MDDGWYDGNHDGRNIFCPPFSLRLALFVSSLIGSALVNGVWCGVPLDDDGDDDDKHDDCGR